MTGVQTCALPIYDTIQTVLQLLPTAVASIGFVSVMSHASAWLAFFASVSEMNANIADPADFWSALNFWIFFAVGHPILQPILWISDVLHGSPGPMVAGLVPATFVIGNIFAIAAFTVSKEVCIWHDISLKSLRLQNANSRIVYSSPRFAVLSI